MMYSLIHTVIILVKFSSIRQGRGEDALMRTSSEKSRKQLLYWNNYSYYIIQPLVKNLDYTQFMLLRFSLRSITCLHSFNSLNDSFILRKTKNNSRKT